MVQGYGRGGDKFCRQFREKDKKVEKKIIFSGGNKKASARYLHWLESVNISLTFQTFRFLKLSAMRQSHRHISDSLPKVSP